MIKNHILDIKYLVISLQISGNKRNVSRKVNHVIVTFAILDNINYIQLPNYHYTVVLYSGTKNYNSLKDALNLLQSKLYDLAETGLLINEVQ